jgi:hypothetical protein
MHVARSMIRVAAFASRVAAQALSANTLDFAFFKTRVQPIFLSERPGHARCIACHGSGTPLRLQPPAAGRTMWTDEESRRNFDAVRRMVVPGSVKSRLLVHPLAESAGGDFYHNSGKHWSSQDDPEWQTLKAWVMGEKLAATDRHPRIIQTNSARNNVHGIDPATNTVVGIKDGSRVYVGIIQEPGGVDVIDTSSMQRVKTIPTQGTIHNAYVTPDGRFLVAGSIAAATINVIDAETDEPCGRSKWISAFGP